MKKIFLASVLVLISIGQSQAQITKPPIINNQKTAGNVATNRSITKPTAYSYDLVLALGWWRLINPGDFSLYNSPYKLTAHTTSDTTIERFAAKTSISFKGWYYAAGFPYWSADSMVHLLALKNLQQVNLGAPMVTNTGFRYLGQMPQLRAVYYSDEVGGCTAHNFDVDDKGFEALLQNRNLEYIGFKDLNKITDVGFNAVRGMAKLKVLYISCWNISDKALLSLEGCSSLETLYLINTNITDEGLKNLLSIKRSLPNLKMIYLNYSHTTRKGESSFVDAWGPPMQIIF